MERHLNLNVLQGQVSFASWDPLCFFDQDLLFYILGTLFNCITTWFSTCGFPPFIGVYEKWKERGKKILPHQVEVIIIYNQRGKQKQHQSAFGGLYTQVCNWKLARGEEVTSLVVTRNFPEFALVLVEGPPGQSRWLLLLLPTALRPIVDLLTLLVSFLCLIMDVHPLKHGVTMSLM